MSLKKLFTGSNPKSSKNAIPKKVVAFITKEQYDSIEECNCGGPVFKYHNTSKNVFVAKCGLYKEIIELDKKTKKMSFITPKKPACNWEVMYNGPRPIFVEINKKLNKSVEKNIKSPDEQLEEKLKLLFRFLYVSNHTSTLDEINLLVKNNLLREPRKTFWFPTTGLFMRMSHKESFEDYEKRIFSKKIIDLGYVPPPTTPPPSAKVTKKHHKKKQVVEEIIASQFIVAESDEESENAESDLESETELVSENESDEESENAESDYGSVTSELIEVVEEQFDDYDDYGDSGEQDYYDD